MHSEAKQVDIFMGESFESFTQPIDPFCNEKMYSLNEMVTY